MPSVDRFMSLDKRQRDAVVPAAIPCVSVEAGSTFGWASISDAQVGIDRFGASAPGSVAMSQLGITADNVASTVRQVISQ
jgi:transketolase